ncbi:hypothetical protein C2W62_02880 [Candidatus Entotheonella serta]|nr:hypothetical protein C2W62_02880 [Candidatus Entotheonella serta]
MAARFAVELAISDDNTRRGFEGMLKSLPDFRLITSSTQASPDLVIMDMQQPYPEMLNRVERARQERPAAAFFVAGFQVNADDVVQLFRVGIADFIELPLKEPEFKQALERFVAQYDRDVQLRPKNGKLINLMGSKGGIGTTTMAVNLAIALKWRDRNKDVVLVDLDFQWGDVALILNLPHSHTISYLAQNHERVSNQEFMQGVLTRHERYNISILPAANPNDEFQLYPETVFKTIETLKSMFHYVVVDSSHVIHNISEEILYQFPELYLVSTLQPPVIRNTEQFITKFPNVDTHVIVNRSESNYEQFTTHDLKYKDRVLYSIPNDYSAASKFLNKEIPITQLWRWKKVTRAYKQLAKRIAARSTITLA